MNMYVPMYMHACNYITILSSHTMCNYMHVCLYSTCAVCSRNLIFSFPLPLHTLYTESLPEFIAHHTTEKLCMPCRLVLPRGSTPSSAQPASRRRPAGVQQALQTGAGGSCRKFPNTYAHVYLLFLYFNFRTFTNLICTH